MTAATIATDPPSACAVAPTSPRQRWVIVALLFCATTLCYADRQIIGLLKPAIAVELGWSETTYGDIVATFSVLYAFGYLLGGRLMDKVGVKRGLGLAMGGWSLSVAAHSLAGGVLGFKLARGALGLCEGGIYPAGIKAVRSWFPPHQRALATGLFNAGANVGALVTPIALPFVVVAFGWRAAFLIVGTLGSLWLAAWLRWFRDAPQAHAGPGPSWFSALRYRGTWAYVAGMMMTSPVWWFYLNWVPGFLHGRFGVNMMGAMLPLVTIYLMADAGGILGGWISSRFIRSGMAPLRARLAAMAVMALFALPVAFIAGVSSLWAGVWLIALGAGAHQGLSANLYTLVSDTLPGGSVSSVVGMGGFAAGVNGMFVAMAVGRVLDATHGNYAALFVAAACAYPLAVLAMALILRSQAARPSPDSSPDKAAA